jgi:SAM-dependent methyltransferase
MSYTQAKLLRFVLWFSAAIAAPVVLITTAYFPYDVDAPLTPQKLDEVRRYYAGAYKDETPIAQEGPSEYETKYVRMATEAAEAAGIYRQVSAVASTYGLQNESVLDIGSGRGYLQDVVENYTGLDISTNVSQYYHKRFVLGSATAMPFRDNTFGGGWSIWVLEHVPNPEQALVEIRRVMKNNAILFLYPAWNCSELAAEGYRVRPYSDFGWKGKLIKASSPVRDSRSFKAAERIPSRIIRSVASRFGPTRLHYRLLQPNYKDYWESDSDALNAIDRYEVMLWFRSRGDECLNCVSLAGSVFMKSPALIIRVHKG